MRLTQELLGYLNRVFNKSPESALAMRVQYAGTDMTWDVAEKTLTVSVFGGTGSGFAVDLEDYTMASLAGYIASLPGFTVTDLATDHAVLALSAAALVDATGDQNSTGGDKFYYYTSNLYAYLEAAAAELETVETAIVEGIKQISIFDENGDDSADGEWLDEIGSYYNVPRITGESSAAYGPRIVAEVLRPRGNNVALEAAIKAFTGQQTSVVNAKVPAFSIPIFNAVVNFDGSHHYNSTGSFQYNIFDVSVGYDLLNGGSIADFEANVTAVVERLRDAGTHMRSLLLTGSAVGDTFNAPSDSFGILLVGAGLGDTLITPTDANIMAIGIIGFSDTLSGYNDNTNVAAISYTTKFNSFRGFDGAIPYAGGLTGTGHIDGSGTIYA